MSPTKLASQSAPGRNRKSQEEDLKKPLATIGSTSEGNNETYDGLELQTISISLKGDALNHRESSILATLSEQRKLVVTCAAFSSLFLSAGFFVHQLFSVPSIQSNQINSSKTPELIKILNTWELSILSPQYLWSTARNLQQDGHLQRPVHLLKHIPENSEFYRDARAEVLALEAAVWQMAQTRYEQGKQDEAIMIAKSIQSDSPHYQVANDSAFDWKQAWETDKPKAEQILALAESTKWDDWMTVRNLYNELTNPYWKNEVESTYQRIEGKILAEQERQQLAEQQKQPSSRGNNTPRSATPISSSPASVAPSGSPGERIEPFEGHGSPGSITGSGQPEGKGSGGGNVRPDHWGQ